MINIKLSRANADAIYRPVHCLLSLPYQPFFPGALLFLSSFYTRKELAVRIAIMYSGNSLSNCFGGLLAAAIISGLQGKGGLAGWRWLFILEGAVTVVGTVCDLGGETYIV